MADDTITLVSTSDTPEQVLEALTGRPSDAKKPTEPAAETPPAEPPKEPTEPAKEPAKEPPAEPAAAAEETAEQKTERETREASEAGSRLNKRKQSIQAEIDELTGRKYNVRRDVEAEEARLGELKRQREELETKQPKPPEAKAAEPAERPEPKVDAVGEDGTAKYATYEEFLSDHTKWGLEQSEAIIKRALAAKEQADRERIERETVSRAANEHLARYQSQLEEFKKTHADFDAAYDDAKDSAQALRIAMGPDVFHTIDGYTVFDAEDGPGLTYYLLKHPDELKAIASKPQPQQIIHLSRLEARIRPEVVQKPGPASPAAPETKAPEPIKPVGSGPTATTVPLDEESYQDFKARRERELRARRSA